MGGFCGVAAKEDCIPDLFYGTDYHSHLGTVRGGMAVHNGTGFKRLIKDITNAQFRSKFEDDLHELGGSLGIGVISDYDDQPLIIRSHLGTYAVVTVGRVDNLEQLARKTLENRSSHFSEMSGDVVNPTELIATLINEGNSFEEGIHHAQEVISGSCSLLLMTSNAIYAARDRYGRTPVALGRKAGAHSVVMETCAFPNLNYETQRHLGPGEILRITADTTETVQPPGEQLRICAFLWVYYGYPASDFEGINTEVVRYRSGALLGRGDDVEVDLVAGIPDSGTGHAIGYANERSLPYGRPFIKYTPTWPRSFMPPDQRVRNLVARMKLIPIKELIAGKRLLFCEDSIVRGTQLQDTIQRLVSAGAREIHMRPACPPLIHGCKFLNFSRSRSVLDLAARRAIKELGDDDRLAEYSDATSRRYHDMVEQIRKRLGLTTLKYQTLDNLVSAIGLPKEKLCTYCWDGAESRCGCQVNTPSASRVPLDTA
ncbi:MAG: amidophosphoribosyltransferase [Pirellulaceae bacterium]